MTEQLSKSRNNPQISANSERMQLKKVDQEVHTMKNRVQLLRQQLQKQKDAIKSNKKKVKEVIEKKINVNKINMLKQKDNSAQEHKVQQLKRRNRSLKQSHQRELENIQKAIYLVKLDDARQVKNISMQHKRKMMDMEREFMSAQKKKKEKVAQQSEKAKQRFQKYWRHKLQTLYTEQAQDLINTVNNKQQKKRELKSLEQEQIKLLQQLNKVHSQEVESKKEYLAALSLPVKDVAEAMGDSLSARRSLANSELSINKSRYGSQSHMNQRKSIDSSELKLPNTHVNQAKLKIILSQLKKSEKRQLNYSARN